MTGVTTVTIDSAEGVRRLEDAGAYPPITAGVRKANGRWCFSASIDCSYSYSHGLCSTEGSGEGGSQTVHYVLSDELVETWADRLNAYDLKVRRSGEWPHTIQAAARESLSQAADELQLAKEDKGSSKTFRNFYLSRAVKFGLLGRKRHADINFVMGRVQIEADSYELDDVKEPLSFASGLGDSEYDSEGDESTCQGHALSHRGQAHSPLVPENEGYETSSIHSEVDSEPPITPLTETRQQHLSPSKDGTVLSFWDDAASPSEHEWCGHEDEVVGYAI